MKKKLVILVASGDQSGRASLTKDIAALGYKVRATDDLSTVLKMTSKEQLALVILDIDLFDAERNGFDVLQEIGRIAPQCPVIALGGENTVLSSLLASRFGAVDFFARPYSFSSLAGTIKIALQEPAKENSTIPNSSAGPLIGNSSAMQQVIQDITNAARSHLPVLINGPTGSGKFLAATLIHKYGKLANNQLHCLVPSADMAVLNKVNAGETLVLRRLNLFSKQKQFLLCDWIDINEQVENPVRIIATNCVQSLVSTDTQTIIPELSNRIQLLHIEFPGLEHRRDDISDLAKDFLGQASSYQKTLNAEAVELLLNSFWEGNARELKNLMVRLANQSSSRVIDATHVGRALVSNLNGKGADPNVSLLVEALLSSRSDQDNLYQTVIHAVEKPLLAIALRRTNNNQVKAARLLGVNRNTLRKKMSLHRMSQEK